MLYLILFGYIEFVIIVHGSPDRVSHHLSSTKVNAIFNETAILPCRINENQFRGNAPKAEKVIWKRQPNNIFLIYGNKRLFQDDRINMMTQSFDSLHANMTISHVRLSDQGVYQCLFSYGGKRFIRNVTLNVQIPATIHKEGSTLSKVTIRENDNLVLRCNFSGKPMPTLVWLAAFNDGMGKRLVCHAKSLISRGNPDYIDCSINGSSIIIHKIKRHMSGVYTCVADNQIKVQSSRDITVEVTYRPEISMLNDKLSQYKDKHTLLQASITGNPINSVYWMKGNTKINGTHSDCILPVDDEKYCIRIDNKGFHNLVTDLWIFNLQEKDFDSYKCVATYPFGLVFGTTVVQQTYEVIPKWNRLENARYYEQNMAGQLNQWNPRENKNRGQENDLLIQAAGLQHVSNPNTCDQIHYHSELMIIYSVASAWMLYILV